MSAVLLRAEQRVGGLRTCYSAIMVRLLLLVSLLAACKSRDSGPGQALTKPPGDAQAARADLTTDLAAIRDKLELPAIAAAVWRDGKLVEQAAVGVRKIDDPGIKVTTADQWHLGSNTKAMTAMLVGIYVDRGKLRWTDTVGQLFKDDKIDASYKNVTLDQLLRHEGGAPETPPEEVWRQLWTDGAAPDARVKFVRAILARPVAQAPGTFVYSNAGYMIAAVALERAAGKRWEDVMREELFGPLGMKSCGFGPPGSATTTDQPWGHDAGGTPIAPGPAADNPPGLGPAGTVHCSLEDYGKFLNVLATGTPALVSPETEQHLLAARTNGYAGGWIVVVQPKGSILLHSGSNTMWYATAMVAPTKRFAFVVVTNKGEQKIEDSLETLLKRFVPAP